MYKNYTDKLEASENCSSCQTLHALVTLSPIKRIADFKFKILSLIDNHTDK